MEFLKSRSFPSFYSEYAPKLIEFFGAWVDWLNQKENAAYIIDHLSSEADIDESLEAYKTHIKYKLLADFPENLAADLKLLLKNIFYLYNSKSSIQSYEFLFRCLFNSPCQLTYPKRQVLRLSHGKWKIPHYLVTEGFPIETNLDKYNNCMITGVESGTTAYIDGMEIYFDEDLNDYQNCVNIVSLNGEFTPGELLIITNPETGEVFEYDFKVVKSLTGEGHWTNSDGMLDEDKVIQDSFYYQDFSYVIRSNVSVNRWNALVKSLIHPAGLTFFNSYVLTSNDVSEIGIYPTDALSFLSIFVIHFKQYILECETQLNSITWKYNLGEASIVQTHSQTIDYLFEHGDDLFFHNNLHNITRHYLTSITNRDSVILFKDNGTIITPNIIDWAHFQFTEPVDSRTLTGITLNPDHHVQYGKIDGNTFTPDNKECTSLNSMVFVSQSKNVKQKKVETLREFDTFYGEVQGEFDNTIVEESTVNTTAVIPNNELKQFKYLTVNDYVSYKLDNVEVFDENSLLKIPEVYVSLEDGTYTIANNDFDDESIVIYNYSDRDVKEKFFVEQTHVNIIRLRHTKEDMSVMQSKTASEELKKLISTDDILVNDFQIKKLDNTVQEDYVYSSIDDTVSFVEEITASSTIQSKDNVICFIDGIFTRDFSLDGNKIILPNKKYSYAEVYILAPIMGTRVLTERYYNDKNFTYNNVHLNRHMFWGAKIIMTWVIDYGNTIHLNEIPCEYEIKWLKLLDFNPELISKSQIIRTTLVQNHSETADRWFFEGNTDLSTIPYTDKIEQTWAKFNSSSTVLFNNGYLIYPEQIDWTVKKIEIDRYLNSYSIKETVIRAKDLVEMQLRDVNIPIQLLSIPMRDNFGEMEMTDTLELKSQSYSSVLQSIALCPETHEYIESFIDGTFVSDDTFDYDSVITDNFFVFVNGLKVPQANVKHENDGYSFTQSYTGSLYIFEHNSELIKEYYEIGTGSVLKLKDTNTDPDLVLVFKDGQYYTDFTIENDILEIKNKASNTCEIFILNKFDYFKKDSAMWSSTDGYFTFTNLRKMPYTPFFEKLIWLREFKLAEMKYFTYQLYRYLHIMNYSIDIESNLTLEKESIAYQPNKDTSVTIHGRLKRLNELVSSEMDHWSEYVIRMCSILQTMVNQPYSSFSKKLSSNSAPVMPTYNTFDSLLYYGTYEIEDESDSNIYMLENELNKCSTMLFDDEGKLVDPDIITWQSLSFNEPVDTNTLTPVVLHGSQPAIFGKSYYLDNATEIKVNEDEFINSDNIFLFVDSKKVYADDYTVDDPYYRFTEPQTGYLTVFNYNENDMQEVIRNHRLNTRFVELSVDLPDPSLLLVFSDGKQTKDFYVSGNTLCLSSDAVGYTIEVYLFKNYDYHYMIENKYNRLYNNFTLNNIKRSTLF